jgi:deoxyribodipyrimidine photolyase-related protein
MSAATLRVVLGDQLSPGIAALRDIDAGRDIVLIAEVAAEASYVRHHKKKIAFLFAAMRHFAEALRARGLRVDYVTLDDLANTGTLADEVARAVRRHGCERIVTTEPGEFRVLSDMQRWDEVAGVPCEIRRDDRFFCAIAEFRDWAGGRKSLRMEYFYREMRRRTGILMDGAEPEGGQWNFDAENRKRLPDHVVIPRRSADAPDAITRAVLDLVAQRFPDHFGDLEPFTFAVTQEDAERRFAHWLKTGLPRFGDFQDAMKQGEPDLFHSVIALYLNAGLLDARAVCARVEAEWRAGRAPLNAAEGFIRQVLGWREYLRGIYWLFMPDYAETNFFGAARKLPWFYWSGATDLNCLRQVVGETKANAFAHHIQRLMVTGNFALLAGLAPKEVCEWYLAVYADAYEWVELPNTHGMALFADGGRLGSKPYAASGKYIQRMSDYCASCRYDVARSAGEDACPFNYLYWNFLIANQARLKDNPRMAMPYRTLARFPAERRRQFQDDARRFLAALA